MNRKIFSIISAVALVLALGSVAKADTCSVATAGVSCFDLTVNNFLGGSVDVGQVDLTLNGNGTITVDITMEPNYGIHNNGFAFNYTGTASNLSVSNCTLTSPGNPTCGGLNIPPPANNFDGFGNYDFSISISGTNGQPNDPTQMVFTLSSLSGFSGLSDIVTAGGGGANNFFAAQVAYIPNSGCTGFAGNTGSTNPNSGTLSPNCPDGTSVPEPGSLALFGTGALGLAGYLRRKLFA